MAGILMANLLTLAMLHPSTASVAAPPPRFPKPPKFQRPPVGDMQKSGSGAITNGAGGTTSRGRTPDDDSMTTESNKGENTVVESSRESGSEIQPGNSGNKTPEAAVNDTSSESAQSPGVYSFHFSWNEAATSSYSGMLVAGLVCTAIAVVVYRRYRRRKVITNHRQSLEGP